MTERYTAVLARFALDDIRKQPEATQLTFGVDPAADHACCPQAMLPAIDVSLCVHLEPSQLKRLPNKVAE